MLKRFALLAILLFTASAAQADWYRAESPNFVLYMDGSQADIRELIERLERLDNFLGRVSGTHSEPPLVKMHVFAVSSARHVQSLHGGGDRDVGGYYRADERGPYAVIPERGVGRGRFGQSAEGILYHEYAHHFLLYYSPSVYPAWYQEGFAEFYSSIEFEGENRIAVGKPVNNRAPALQLGRWIPVEAILSGSEVPSDMLYAQAWLITHYTVFNSDAREQLRAYLQALRDGDTAADAYRATFGATGIDYDDVLRDYMNNPLRALMLTVEPPAASEITIERLSDERGETALLSIRHDEDGLEEARELLEDYPENPQILAELARLQIENEEFDAALGTAEQALAIDPDHVDGNLYKG
ncbi:MAG: tetratricopeptide repeat protein, partial [Sphingomonadales bacterium]|nr:tetratricopeptide repeat protein [Sphingomonadales bacterium]